MLIDFSVYRGKVVKLESFGAFVAIDGHKQQGLVHISQLAKDRVESVSEVVTVDQMVYVKVLAIEGDNPARPKISLSMKYADQSNGVDRDPNGVDAELNARRKTAWKGEQGPVKLEAVLNTICRRCGGSGHISSECFNTSGVKYDLLEAEPEEKVFPDTKSSQPPSVSVGRGRGAVLPSWVTNSTDTNLGGIVSYDGKLCDEGGKVKKEKKDKRDKKDKKDKKDKRSKKKSVDKKKRHKEKKDKKHKKDKKKDRKKSTLIDDNAEINSQSSTSASSSSGSYSSASDRS